MKLVRASLLAVTLITSCITYAGEWERNASVDLGSYYSTNVCLVNSDLAEEEGEFVGTFRPAVNVSGEGARTALNLRAAVEYNSLGDSSLDCPQGTQGSNLENRRAWVPSIDFDSSLNVIDGWADIYATLFASQNPINPFIPGGADNANAVGNTNVVYQWALGTRTDRVSPSGWQFLSEVEYNRQYNSVNQVVGDSDEASAEYDFGRLPFVSRFFYGSRGAYGEIDFRETGLNEAFSTRLAKAEIYAGLTIARDLLFEAAYGEENNEFDSLEDDIDGPYWSTVFRWQPQERISVSVGYGERFFGDTPKFEVNYSHKRSTLLMGYLRDIQLPRNIRAGNITGDVSTPPSAPTLEVPGDTLVDDGTPTFAGNSTVLNDSFYFSYELVGRSTGFELTATVSEQEELSTGRIADFQRARAKIVRQVSSLTRASVSIGWDRNERADTLAGSSFGGFERYYLDLGVSRPAGANSSVSLRYRFTDQTSDDLLSLNQFEEQQVAISFTFDL